MTGTQRVPKICVQEDFTIQIKGTEFLTDTNQGLPKRIAT